MTPFLNRGDCQHDAAAAPTRGDLLMSSQHTTIQAHRRRPVRGVLDRSRRWPAEALASGGRQRVDAAPASDEALAVTAAPVSDEALAVNAASHGEQPRPLRRWSVAQLIAQAVARPPGGSLAH
jgi:hypothetical protein